MLLMIKIFKLKILIKLLLIKIVLNQNLGNFIFYFISKIK